MYAKLDEQQSRMEGTVEDTINGNVTNPLISLVETIRSSLGMYGIEAALFHVEKQIVEGRLSNSYEVEVSLLHHCKVRRNDK